MNYCLPKVLLTTPPALQVKSMQGLVHQQGQSFKELKDKLDGALNAMALQSSELDAQQIRMSKLETSFQACMDKLKEDQDAAFSKLSYQVAHLVSNILSTAYSMPETVLLWYLLAIAIKRFLCISTDLIDHCQYCISDAHGLFCRMTGWQQT